VTVQAFQTLLFNFVKVALDGGKQKKGHHKHSKVKVQKTEKKKTLPVYVILTG
jgi:hypothetical protein